MFIEQTELNRILDYITEHIGEDLVYDIDKHIQQIPNCTISKFMEVLENYNYYKTKE